MGILFYVLVSCQVSTLKGTPEKVANYFKIYGVIRPYKGSIMRQTNYNLAQPELTMNSRVAIFGGQLLRKKFITSNPWIRTCIHWLSYFHPTSVLDELWVSKFWFKKNHHILKCFTYLTDNSHQERGINLITPRKCTPDFLQRSFFVRLLKLFGVQSK